MLREPKKKKSTGSAVVVMGTAAGAAAAAASHNGDPGNALLVVPFLKVRVLNQTTGRESGCLPLSFAVEAAIDSSRSTPISGQAKPHHGVLTSVRCARSLACLPLPTMARHQRLRRNQQVPHRLRSRSFHCTRHLRLQQRRRRYFLSAVRRWHLPTGQVRADSAPHARWRTAKPCTLRMEI